MKVYTAVYKENKNGFLRSMKSEYATKSDFEHDLRVNGYIPVAILTDNQITAIKNHDEKMNSRFLNLDFEFVRECL